MSNLDDGRNDDLTDLLVKQVTEGLSADEHAALVAIDPTRVAARRQSLALLLGAVSAVLTAPLEAPPETLRAKLQQQAAQHFERHPPSRGSTQETHIATGANVRARLPSSTRWAWLSAAACLILAVVGWMRPPRLIAPPAPVTVQVDVPPVKVSAPKVSGPVLTSAQLRDVLLTRSDVVKVSLAATKDPAANGVSADVVWDPQTNSGFLHIGGLKPNDPANTQYQAWVFDAGRDKRYPLNCALFNVSGDSSELVIPIQTSIPVRMAKAFAITVEQAGGVVVPNKAHVVVLGSAG